MSWDVDAYPPLHDDEPDGPACGGITLALLLSFFLWVGIVSLVRFALGVIG